MHDAENMHEMVIDSVDEKVRKRFQRPRSFVKSSQSTERTKGDARSDTRGLIADLQRQQVSNEFASKLEHSFKSGIHFLFFNELSPRDLVDPHLTCF